MKPMNIFTKTLYEHRLSMLFWFTGLFLTVIMYVTMFPSVSEATELAEAMASMPEAFQALIGDLSTINTPEGYLQAELFSAMLPLIFAIITISFGSNAIYKEESSGTIELLLARPIRRSSILTHKILAMVTMLTIIGSASIIGLLVGQQIVDFPINSDHYISAVALSYALGLVFGMLAFCITAIRPLKGLSIGLPSAYLLVGFIVTGFADSIELFNTLKYASPFNYHQTMDVLLYGMRWVDLGILLGLSVLLFIISLLAFRRRDVGI